MSSVRRAGRYFRVADPDWDEPLEGSYSARLGGRWNPSGSFPVCYLNRDVRTVQRWEKSEALPVHRHFHKQMSSVYALKREIEEWRRSRSGAQSKSIENNRLTGRSKAKLGTAGRVWMSLGSRLTTLLHSPVGSTATSVSRRLMGW